MDFGFLTNLDSFEPLPTFNMKYPFLTNDFFVFKESSNHNYNKYEEYLELFKK